MRTLHSLPHGIPIFVSPYAQRVRLLIHKVSYDTQGPRPM
jgi:hypothetical protein